MRGEVAQRDAAGGPARRLAAPALQAARQQLMTIGGWIGAKELAVRFLLVGRVVERQV